MSATPVVLNPFNTRPIFTITRPKSHLRKSWFPVFCALLFICFTSTNFMGGGHTQIVVSAVWKAIFGTWHANAAGYVNGIGRKVGHFFGYGIVGLILRNAWYNSAKAFAWVERHWLMAFAAVLSVASTFAVASLDEYHQMFIPGRVGCLHDAVIDASGAICLNLAYWMIVRRRRALASRDERQTATVMTFSQRPAGRALEPAA